MRTLTSESIGVFIVDKLASLSLDQKSFPYRNPYEHILQDPFLIGVFFITIARGTQEISLYIYVETKLGFRQNRQPSYSLHLGDVSLQHKSRVNVVNFVDILVRQVQTYTRPIGLFGASLYPLSCVVRILQNYPYHNPCLRTDIMNCNCAITVSLDYKTYRILFRLGNLEVLKQFFLIQFS